MISKEFGGVVLVVLPLVPLIASVLTKSETRKRLLELLLVLTTLFSLFFSYQYSRLADLDSVVHGIESSSFSERLFHYFFGNFLVPVIYFLALAIAYFCLSRLKPAKREDR